VSPEDQIGIEDRVRVATRAGASLIRDVRPLDAPKPVRLRRRSERASRRWINWGVPLAAAAAVVAIALTLVAVRQPDTPSPAASRSATATTPATIPRYYAAFTGDARAPSSSGPLIVGDDLTGKVIATVGPPRGLVFTSVQGMSDDRTFVVTAADQAAPDGSPSSTWYLLRITLGRADSYSYQLTKLQIKLPGNGPGVLAYAASPDGRELAIESQPASVSVSPVTTLGIYSVSSGAELRVWTTPRKIVSALGASTLSWLSGGRQLVFSTSEFKTGSVYNVSLRTLNVTGTGTDLMTASRTLLSIDNTGGSTCVSLHITPDGGTVICGTQYAFLTGTGTGSNAGCANGGLEFIDVSFPVRLSKTPVLYQYRGACHNGVSYLPWTDASGSTIIGVTVINPFNEGGKQAGQVGVITDGHLRPLKIANSVSSPRDYASLSF
jgi:hypothetical protein